MTEINGGGSSETLLPGREDEAGFKGIKPTKEGFISIYKQAELKSPCNLPWHRGAKIEPTLVAWSYGETLM